MASVPIGQIANYTSATRKPNLKTFGNFSPNDNLGFIASGSGLGSTQVVLTGTIDGSNRVFTIPGTIPNQAQVYRNGILLDPALSYALSANTVTFTVAATPQVGDDLNAIVS